MNSRTSSRGLTLIEVLVAVVVLATGLLGASMLIASTVRETHETAVQSQATFLAQSIMDRMASNVQGVWLDSYDTDISVFEPGFSTACSAYSCDAASLATRDLTQWRTEVAQLLPTATNARVACDPAGPVPGPDQLRKRPIYSGSCSLALEWREVSPDGTTELRRVAWRFAP